MIVSNVDETNKDLVLSSIKTMGDTLGKIVKNYKYRNKNSIILNFNLKLQTDEWLQVISVIFYRIVSLVLLIKSLLNWF